MFGVWLPYESLPLASAVDVKPPPILLEPADMMITNVEIDGGKIHYSAFDTLRAVPISCPGLEQVSKRDEMSGTTYVDTTP